MRDPTPVIISKKSEERGSSVNLNGITNELPVRDGIVIQLNKVTLNGASKTIAVVPKRNTDKINGIATARVAIAQTIPTLACLNTKAFNNAPIKGINTTRTRK